jgi:hypothetical protein
MNKTYNVAAFGIPVELTRAVTKLAYGDNNLQLRYTRHAMSEALGDRYGVLPSTAFPTLLDLSEGWTIVEAEADAKGALVKFVVRRPVDARRSLVLVVLADGTVKTLWTNLNSDQHATLNSSHFSRP